MKELSSAFILLPLKIPYNINRATGVPVLVRHYIGPPVKSDMATFLTAVLPFLHSHYSSLSFSVAPIRSPITISPFSSSQLSSVILSCKYGHRRTARLPFSIMSSAKSQPDVTELREESDFHSLVSPSGLISICGFGSLLSGKYNYHHSVMHFSCVYLITDSLI